MEAQFANMDTEVLLELSDAVDVREKEFSEFSRSISELSEDDHPDDEAYIKEFYERVHGFMDKTTDLIAAYQEYIAALENACTEQEE
jgi:hypothetical protein|uniref:Uncharacterized protein n=1 Tax=uncultured Methanosarcinales archaeon TaxID=183757 RepID=A0A7H1KP62_9EURY|nr:hypothetical protein BODMHOLK_00017 [uncultured Methanosarcinales archaeon]